MAADYSNSWVTSTPANPVSVTISPAADDLLISVAITDTAAAGDLDSTPSGWTQQHRGQSTNDNMTFQSCWKKATGAETAVAFQSSSTNSQIAGVIACSGVDTATPLDVTPATVASSTAQTTTDLSITPVSDGCLLVYVIGVDAGSSDYSFSFSTTAGSTGSWTVRRDINNGFLNYAIATAVQTTAGAVTVRCTSTSGGRVGVLYALRPAATGTSEQTAFRFGVDDGNEASHTWAASENANLSAATGTKLLRLQVDSTGDLASAAYTLRAQKNGSGGYLPVNVGSTTKITPVLESGDVTSSGNNTATGSWAVSHPAASTGDLLIWVIAWDDSTAVTGVTPPSGPNGETLTAINATPVTDASTETRIKAWYTVATGSWSASTRTFTPSASEQWQAHVIKVPAGEFDSVTPIGAVGTAAATGVADTAALSPAYTVGASDGSGKLVWATSVDADALVTLDNGWTAIANTRLSTTISNGVAVRDSAVSDSESVSAASWTIASDSWASVAFVVRAPTVTNEVYVDASANIAAGGEATTARLSVPNSHSFTTGRRWDNENGSDATDIAANNYSEFEWCITLAGSLSNGDYYDFRLYAGTTALTTYTNTARWTVSASSTGTGAPVTVNVTTAAGSATGQASGSGGGLSVSATVAAGSATGGASATGGGVSVAVTVGAPGASGGASASGGGVSVNVTPAAGSASGGAAASGGGVSVSVTPAAGSATGAASASGGGVSVAVTPAAGSAQAGATVSGGGVSVAVTVGAGTATGAAAGTGGGISVAVTVGAGSATAAGVGTGNGAPVSVAVTVGAGTGTGGAAASGGGLTVSVTAGAGSVGGAGAGSGGTVTTSVTVAAGAATGQAAASGSGVTVVVTPAAGSGSGAAAATGAGVSVAVTVAAGSGSTLGAGNGAPVSVAVTVGAGAASGAASGTGAGLVVSVTAAPSSAGGAAQASGGGISVTVSAGGGTAGGASTGSGGGVTVAVSASDGAASGAAHGLGAPVLVVVSVAVGFADPGSAVGAAVLVAVLVAAGSAIGLVRPFFRPLPPRMVTEDVAATSSEFTDLELGSITTEDFVLGPDTEER